MSFAPYPSSYSRQPFPHLELTGLPRLPLPTLQETITRFLEYTKPLTTRHQHIQASREAQEFLNGEGPKLQKELEELAATTPTSYIEGYWETAYVRPRIPTPINVNPAFLFRDSVQVSQLKRATWMIHASVLYYTRIRNGELPPDVSGKNRTPLCMTQHGAFFATYRVPQVGRDAVFTSRGSRHVVVLERNQFFSITVLEENGKPLPQSTIQRSLAEIKLATSNTSLSWKYPVGVLTTLPRDEWAKHRSHLLSDEENKNSLRTIDEALFIVCLDDEEPTTDTQQLESVLHNTDGSNRWYDKLSLIICANGVSGVNLEHSLVDGHSVLNYLAFMHNYKEEPEKRYYTPSTVKHLPFTLDAATKNAIFNARLRFSDLAESTDCCVLRFEEFGSTMTKAVKVSADSFAQMAFQLAFSKLRPNQFASTYESCQTKRFYHGRTEAIRSVTVESAAMCKNLTREAILDAILAHRRVVADCTKGKGVDRHLHALRSLAEEKQRKFAGYQFPAMLKSEAYKTLTSSVLSTSNCGSESVSVFGFGPVVSNGLGIGYVIHPNSMQICATSFSSGEAHRFCERLKESMVEMMNVLKSQTNAKL